MNIDDPNVAATKYDVYTYLWHMPIHMSVPISMRTSTHIYTHIYTHVHRHLYGRPGCWAYPDMLEVGNFVGPNSYNESRTHFGAW